MQRHTKRKEFFGGVRNFPFHSAFHIELRKDMNLKYISGDLLKFVGAAYPLGKAEPELCQEDTLPVSFLGRTSGTSSPPFSFGV